MAALIDVERLFSECCRQHVGSGMAAGRDECARRSAIGTRILLRATTSRFRPAKYLPASDLPLFLELEQHGWMFREACPRYYLCWRNSALIVETRSPVAIFPLSLPIIRSGPRNYAGRRGEGRIGSDHLVGLSEKVECPCLETGAFGCHCSSRHKLVARGEDELHRE